MGNVSVTAKLAEIKAKKAENEAKSSASQSRVSIKNTKVSAKSEEQKQLELKLEQAKHREERLMAQNKTKERKERTRRLIKRGAILESNIKNAESYSDEQIACLLSLLNHKGYISECLKSLN